jgi:DNA-binding response OmpR family regulator
MKPILLIADGDIELRERFEMFLSEHGYDVEIASDGLDCMEKLRQLTPSALILDHNLHWGGADGVVACLREQSGFSDVPVVLTATAGACMHLIEPPIVSFLQKPFGLRILLDSVVTAVSKSPREKHAVSSEN